MPEDRRLAAIMFTDIVGYTALMGSDEDKAFKTLRKNRNIQRPIIKKYRGEWLKEMGDGILASFRTASDAVRCAIEIQQISKQEGVPLRIGIHEGEVVFEGGDVLGDGVNVASRLEEFAEEGAINISGAVYKDIKNKAGITAEFVEEKELKNVDEPVKVYKVKCEEPEPEVLEEKPSKKITNKLPYYIITGLVVVIAAIIILQFLPKKESTSIAEKTEIVKEDKSIAVLPFGNESTDTENEYFVNGMMEDIRNNLSKIGDLRVISKTSTEKYRDTNLSVSEIAKELDVNYLLEGSVQKQGNQVKIHAQLIEAVIDDHIWSETFLRDISDVFEVQSEIAQIISKELYATLTPQEKKIIEIIPTTNFLAYDFFLQARNAHMDYWLDNSDNDALDKAISLYNRALENDTSYAQAYTGLALAYWDNNWGFFEPSYLEDGSMDTVLILANKALNYDDLLDEAYYVRGLYFSNIKSEYNKALAAFNKALSINPNYSFALFQRGNMYINNLEDFVNGIKDYHKVVNLDRSSFLPRYIRYLGWAYHSTGFNDFALYYLQEASKLDNDSTSYINLLNSLKINENDFKTRLEIYKKRYQEDSTDSFGIYDIILTYSIIGNYQEAYNYSLKLIELADREELTNLNLTHRIAYSLWKVGKKEEAKRYFDEQIKHCEKSIKLNRNYATTKAAYYDLAGVYGFLGEKEKAYQYLDEFDKRTFCPIWWMYLFKYDPLFENLNKDERFQQLLQNQEIKFQKVHEKVRIWMEQEGLL